MSAAPKVGARALLIGNHSHRGERGEIVARPGSVFHDWTVRLDSGLYVGASARQISVRLARVEKSE